MNVLFALLRRTLAVLAFAACAGVTASAQTPPNDDATTAPAAPAVAPAGGHFKDCHGFIRHVSDLNIKVHCIDGDASDQSFLYFPKYTNLRDGKSVQTATLRPQTPIHIIYTQSLGIKKAYKIFVADPNGHGLYGFRS
jgi:hypothetical protein